MSTEREFSRSVAQYLGVEHIELGLPADSLRCSLAATIAALEEPRMGMAYVNYRIAERVSRDSKVVLSGCGGDEILAGYVGRYGVARDRAAMLSRPTGLTGWLRSLLSTPKPTRETIREAILPMFSYPLLDSELDLAFTPDFGASRATTECVMVLANWSGMPVRQCLGCAYVRGP